MYRHVQVGWTILAIVGPGIIITSYLGVTRGSAIAGVTALILALLVALFSSLTVTADNQMIVMQFGIGLVKKEIRLSEVRVCQTARNKWWQGWGIRKISNGWLYNVQGIQAVELVLRNGRIYRIGTDEPEKLARFIQERLPQDAH